MDSWNLTLDHSCFDDDESLQQKIVIGGNDVTQTLKRVSGLVNQCDSSQLEDQLTISFFKISFYNNNTCINYKLNFP